VALGDRLLVTAEFSPKNGIWLVSDLGSAGTPWVLTRATDADTTAELPVGSVAYDLAIGGLWVALGPGGAAWILAPTQSGALFLGLPADVELRRSAAKTLELSDAAGGAADFVVLGGLAVANTRPASTALSFSGSIAAATATLALAPLSGVSTNGLVLPWAGSIIAITIRAASGQTAGTATAQAKVSGVAVGPTAALTTTAKGANRAERAAGVTTFAAGESLAAQIVTAAWAPTADLCQVDVYVVFDAAG
jgi:hypothetical protein